MENFQLLYQAAVTACRTKIKTALAEAGIGDDAIASALIHLKEGPHSQTYSKGFKLRINSLHTSKDTLG